MKNHGAINLFLLFVLLIVEVSAESYRNAISHYTITFSDDWKQKVSSKKSKDLILLCISDTCGKVTNLEIGARYFPQLQDRSTEDFLKHANGEKLTRYLRQLPEVADYMIVHEGQATLGEFPAYEVVIKYRLGDGRAGRRMIRHIFVTFDNGNAYQVAFSSYAEHYEHDFALARNVLATFAIQH